MLSYAIGLSIIVGAKRKMLSKSSTHIELVTESYRVIAIQFAASFPPACHQSQNLMDFFLWSAKPHAFFGSDERALDQNRVEHHCVQDFVLACTINQSKFLGR
jgi:hypothetical protein